MSGVQVFLSLGTNLGDREENLLKAIALIEKMVGAVSKQSSVFETKAWGNTELNDFYNQVLIVTSTLQPFDLLRKTQLIEKRMGRESKSEGEYKNRIIDIDILFYGNELINNDEELRIPHRFLHTRNFVLMPLVEISPQFIHPKMLKSTAELLAACSDQANCIKIG